MGWPSVSSRGTCFPRFLSHSTCPSSTAMVNWSDPAEILKDSDAFAKIIYLFFGIQLWEVITTAGFEWSLLTRRRKFRWPLVRTSFFFFLSRYCMLFSMIGLIISLSISHPINCGWTGNMAILCASTSLMLRTIALWERKRNVVIPLGLLSLTCVVVSTNPSLLNVTFFFTMGFDFVILSTTAVALMGRHSARTDLWKLLFTDGLVYFVVSFCMNCIPAVSNYVRSCNWQHSIHRLAYSRTNPARSIAACRAVIRLLDYNSDVYIHSMAAVMPSSDPRHSNAPFSLPTVPGFTLTRPEGVLVTTEHITMSEFPSPIPTAYSKTELHRYDVEAGRHGMDIDNNSTSEKDMDDAVESSEYTATT
ncbi:hypothetical protein B0H17DRAFT_1047472 [Mycena rosella]|uniref:Uncharacterized protein n=1 Tax=Mycena rosella TaxID=1033263 RepID=A0AAD7GQF0_MYCRO|nr:hypothetical protein B0H17DRAFT_1047472 [Mycena rosella]